MTNTNNVDYSSLLNRSPHDPMLYGRRHSMPEADLAALNERQAKLRTIVDGLPFEAAVAELLLSSVRHAVDYIGEDDLADALVEIATEIDYADYKFLDLYAFIVEAFKGETDDDV